MNETSARDHWMTAINAGSLCSGILYLQSFCLGLAACDQGADLYSVSDNSFEWWATQNRTIIDTQTRTSAHMTDVVRRIHLD